MYILNLQLSSSDYFLDIPVYHNTMQSCKNKCKS